MFLLGLAIFVLFTAFIIIALGGDVYNFINLPTILFIIVPLVGILTATRSFKVFGVGFKAIVFSKEPISEEMRGKAASLFRFLSKSTALIAALMVLICIINMLMNIDFNDPAVIPHIGTNVAASLVSMVYGVILIAAVFEPIVFILKKRQDKERK